MNFWNGRKVFITGHTGFKGTWLVLLLKSLGADITGYSIGVPTTPGIFDLVDAGRDIIDIRGDIRDLDTLKDAVSASIPEVVFHLAAQSLVITGHANPVETYAVNVMGTVNILEAIRSIGGVRAVVVVTSDKCYDNSGENLAFKEDAPLGGREPYSSSKGAAELVTAAYRNTYFNPAVYNEMHCTGIATARAGNVIGGGDWASNRIVPDIVRALVSGKTLQIRMPAAVRPWQHVLEPLEGYLLLAEKLYKDGKNFAEGWNFGPGRTAAISVYELVNTVMDSWGGAASSIEMAIPVNEDMCLSLDCSKAVERLGWNHKLSIGNAVSLTVEWYKAWAAGNDMRSITLDQVRKFTNLVSEG